MLLLRPQYSWRHTKGFDVVSIPAQSHALLHVLYLRGKYCLPVSFYSPLARLHSDREQESGFYTGHIEAVDIDSHKYWVTFDRPGLGKHPVADTEIRVSLCELHCC